MVGYLDQISGYGVGAAMTPMLTGSGAGASNPTGSYYQQAAAPTASGISFNNGVMGAGAMTPPGMTTPGASPGGGGKSTGLGWNLGTAELAIGGIQTIGSLWQAWEANKLAKEQFKFAKDFANTNLANQIQSYNTTLEDRTRARSHTEGGSAEDAQAYIDEHSLRKRTA